MSAGTCLNCGNKAPWLVRGLCWRRGCYRSTDTREQFTARRPQRAWTHRELARIMEFREAGQSFIRIAETMGRTLDSVKLAYRRNRGPECIVCGRRCPRRSHLDRIGWQTQPAPWGNGHVVALCPGCFKLHGWGSVPERATV